ncbi:protein required for normal CLN1 and CLN2 G1 cyclin expression [Rhodotorula kratochvilovae]
MKVDGPAPVPVAAPSRGILEVMSQSNELLEIPLADIFTATSEDDVQQQLADVARLLTDEKAPVLPWVRLVEQCWLHGRTRTALSFADQALAALAPADRVAVFCLKANYHLALARKAPKQRPDNLSTGPIATTKDPNHPEFVRPGAAPPPLGPMVKTDYLYRAGADISNAENIDPASKVVRDVKAAWCMASGNFDQASKTWESILADEPTHLMALMGRARIQFSQRAFRPALKTYQEVLRLRPGFLPDPRIGIGLCFWMLGDREKARRAWERSMAVNPNNPSPAAALLLGLLHLNASKDPLHSGGTSARASAYSRGLGLIQAAFKKDNTSVCAGAMGPIAAHLLSTGGPPGAALKLAERMLAFADARLLLGEAHLLRARALDADPSTAPFAGADVLASYLRAGEANPDLAMAHLGAGALYIRTEQFPQALHAFETLLRRHPRCVEALVAQASIQAHLAFTFHSVGDSAGARRAAKDAYEQVLRVFAQGKGGDNLGVAKSERVRVLAADRDLYVEIARLWADEEPSVEKSLQAWLQAARIEQDAADDRAEDAGQDPTADGGEDAVDPRIRNNLGVLFYNRRNGTSTAALDPAAAAGAGAGAGPGKHLVRAQGEFELAAKKLGAQFDGSFDGGETDAALTVVGFNLAAVREALGDVDKAKSEWQGLLQVHPEFVEAKARLALLAIKSKDRAQWDTAHNLIKEALTSQPANAELRALYTFCLFETGQYRVARDFARATLKEVSRHDVYALCASGALYYLEARENKSSHKDAQRDRVAKFTRAAEFFDKALQVSPACAFAAQGLAIGLAESTFGNGPAEAAVSVAASGGAGGVGAPQPLTEGQARMRNARDALNVLTKVKESVNDASVYINIGHCHFQRGEYDRAVENYAVASRRYLHGKSATVLWYLARALFHKADQEHSFAAVQRAIEFGQKATDLAPNDLVNKYNMALLKQMGMVILSQLAVEKRTSAELKAAYEHLQSSMILFDELAASTVEPSPYPRDMVKQRKSYAASLERRFQQLLDAQDAYEATESGKLEQARRARDEEQKRRDEAEKEKLAAIARQAEALAEQRRRMREEAEQWAAMSKEWADADDDDEARKKRGAGGGKKRKSTKIKGGDDDGFDESSSGEEVEKPAKKKRAAKKDKEPKAKKGGKKSKAAAAASQGDGEARAMDLDEQYDEDDEDAPIRARRRKTKSSGLVKSAEFVEDSE